MVPNRASHYLLCSCSNTILQKNLVLRYMAKVVSANQIAEFWNQLYLHIKLMRFLNWFWASWYKFMKINSWWKCFWASMLKIGCDHPDRRTLKLAVSHEWIDRATVLCKLIQYQESYNFLQWFLCRPNKKWL